VTVEVCESAAAAWKDETLREQRGLAFAGDCAAWYKDADGTIPTNCSFSVLDFLRKTWTPKLADFVIE